MKIMSSWDLPTKMSMMLLGPRSLVLRLTLHRGRDRGLVLCGSPVTKRLALSYVSLLLAEKRFTSDAVMACLLGGWTSALLYRRPVTCHQEFSFAEVNQERPRVLPLSRKSAEELVILSVLSPVICVNLGAEMSAEVFATDASEFGGAAVKAQVDQPLARDLWRLGRKKGGYSRF